MLGILLLLAAPAAQTENLIAFAKLYGYVRFFHPSDEASRIDWDRFAVCGVSRVRKAESPEELQASLEALFDPIAPTVRVFPHGEDPREPLDLWPKSTEGLSVVAWQHKGVGLGTGRIYDSIRTNRRGSRPALSAGFGTISRSLPARELRGKKVRLRAAVRTRVEGAGNQGHLWLRVDRPNGEMGFFDNMSERPIRTDEWEVFEIAGEIDEDAESVSFGGFLRGSGSMWLDAFELQVEDEGGSFGSAPIENPGFENGPDRSGWRSPSQGYSYGLETGDCYQGRSCALIATEFQPSPPRLFDERPEVGEVASKMLARGLRVEVPLALFGDEERTYGGRIDAPVAEGFRRSVEELDLAPGDETSARLGAVVVAWNVFQHFYPYFDVVEVDWERVLAESIEETLAVEDETSFERVLKRLVAELDDGHGSVFRPAAEEAYLPIVVDWIESELVVTRSEAAEVRRGDVIASLNGEPASAVLERTEALISGSPQWKRNRALGNFGSGRVGTSIQILTKGDELPRTLTRSRKTPLAEARPEAIAEIEKDIHYVDLTRAAFAAVRERLDELAGAKGIVVDMRGYPQGGSHEFLRHLTDVPLQSAQWMIPRILYPDREKPVGYETSGRWLLNPRAPRLRAKVVFLTHAGAISYGESVMGIVEHYRLGEIVGKPTAGANGNVNSFSVPGGYQVFWTGMRVVKHDGSQHHLVGILPTVPVERTIGAVREGRDEFLEKALQLLR